MNRERQQYGFGLIISLIIHGGLAALLLISIKTGINTNALPSPQGEIVQAVMVDEKLVNAEVKRLETEQLQQKTEEENRKQALAQKAAEAKQEREQEQAKLEKLKQELAKVKKVEEEQLADIKIAKEKEQKQLEVLRQKKEKEQKELTALDDQRQAEQDRAQQMRVEREKEEKRKQVAQQQAEAKQKQAEAKRLAALKAEKLRAENQKRIMSEAERILNEWGARVRSNKREAFELPGDLFCNLIVSLLPDGNVQDIRILKSSGNPVYDNLVITAVRKTEPFDMPGDPSVRDQVKSFELGVKNIEDGTT